MLVAAAEWRYWLRSQLALCGILVFLVLVVATSLLSAVRMDAEQHARTHQQTEAEKTFLAQPDRHPHRMVHYGHYLFRTAAPLSLFDPGLDAVTGQSIFLEGHRQNTVMFAESAASADFGGLSWLNPALIYQLFGPLLIVLLGHGSFVREREASVLVPLIALGITADKVVLGKAIALLSFTLFLLLPLIGSCVFALAAGESVVAVISLIGIYGVYLSIWVCLTLLISTLVKKRSMVLASMTGLWLILSLVLPSVAVNFVVVAEPVAGKIHSDLKILTDLRKLGDGHNANDPAFMKLRADLLEQYSVESVAELPVNFRGLVAMEAEKKLTKVLNDYAQLRMAAELRQEERLQKFSWLTPALAIALVSRSISATDLVHYHRFQKEAEAVRFGFVQGLNNAHAKELSYQADINRNRDEASWRRARVDATNWQVLESFEFQVASPSDRIENAASTICVLLLWLLLTFSVLMWRSRRIEP